jgi:hypothetical protein
LTGGADIHCAARLLVLKPPLFLPDAPLFLLDAPLFLLDAPLFPSEANEA